jgi:predicted nucleotidyltransferase
MDSRIIGLANAIRSTRFDGANAVFAAGSIVRGEGTATSDLDLVVVYPRLECAYRESFIFDGFPVEAFVHDAETLEYFFLELDRPSGIPALPQMIVEGVEIPASTEVSQALKQRAVAIIAMGPPPLDSPTEQRMRYFVSDSLDDLRAPRSRDELMARERSCIRNSRTIICAVRVCGQRKERQFPRPSTGRSATVCEILSMLQCSLHVGRRERRHCLSGGSATSFWWTVVRGLQSRCAAYLEKTSVRRNLGSERDSPAIN